MMPEGSLEQFINKLKGNQDEPPDESAIVGKIEEIKKRELRRYKEAQNKKWAKWLEAMRR